MLVFVASSLTAFEGPLPDFEADRHNSVLDYRTGDYLRPLLPGESFEWPTVAQVDWNNDGLFDLLVGYNLRKPDVIRMVVYVNQGSVGQPQFTGEPSPATSFYLEVTYQGEGSPRIFQGRGWHGHEPHKWLVHSPAVYDFNNDGLFDIFVNEGAYDPKNQRGQWLLVNTGSPGGPKFKAVYLHQDNVEKQLPPGPYISAMKLFHPLPEEIAKSYPAVTMLDWDSDGVPDIQYTSRNTHILYGAVDKDGNWYSRDGKWVAAILGTNGDVDRKAHIVSADFDKDGVNELIVANPTNFKGRGSDGYLSLFVRDRSARDVRYIPQTRFLFSLNEDSDPGLFSRVSSWFNSTYGWWHPRVSVVDFDEDGDPDLLGGWGGGNGQRQVGDKMYLYRTPGGIPGSHPIYENQKHSAERMAHGAEN